MVGTIWTFDVDGAYYSVKPGLLGLCWNTFVQFSLVMLVYGRVHDYWTNYEGLDDADIPNVTYI